MKRKMVFLSALEVTKEAVDSINSYFDKGYEIEEILDADCGYYIFLVWDTYRHMFDFSDSKYPLIEEKKDSAQSWVKSNTNDVKLN